MSAVLRPLGELVQAPAPTPVPVPDMVLETDDGVPEEAVEDVEDEDEEHPPNELPPELVNEQVLRACYMLKRADKSKMWKRRWVVLRASRLAFYRNEKEYQLINVVGANELRTIVPVDFKRLGTTICIVTSQRTYYLRAANAEETQTWIELLNQVRVAASGAIPSSGDTPLPRSASSRTLGSAGGSMACPGNSSAAVPATLKRGAPPPVGIMQVYGDENPRETLGTSPPSSMQRARASFARWYTYETARDGDARMASNCETEGRGPASPTSGEPPVMQRLPVPHGPMILSSSEEEGEGEEADVAMPLPGKMPEAVRGCGSGCSSGVPENPDRVIAQGYLMKQSSRRKQWRKRWFVLTPRMLYYAHNHLETRARRHVPTTLVLDVMEHEPTSAISTSPTITLPGGSAIALRGFGSPELRPSGKPAREDDQAGESRTPHCFKIVTTKRTYVLCAPTEEEEIMWISALQTILNRQRNGTASAALR